MTIKKLAHTAQRAIQATSGSAFKLGHIYELLAAALGFASYASLCTDHVFDVNPGRRSDVANRLLDRIHPRAISLGHAPEVALLAATTLAHAVEEERICVRHIDDVLRSAQQGYGFVDDFSGDDDDDLQEAEGAWADADPGHPSSGAYSTVLRESLQRGAAAGDHRAHYALALLPGVDQDEFDDIEAEGSAHWYRLRQEGTELHGVEKEWADAYAATLERAQALQRVDEAALMHLEQAAELGNTDALMDLAEQRGDRMYFHRAAAAGGNPSRLADLAGRFDQPNIQHWLTRAANMAMHGRCARSSSSSITAICGHAGNGSTTRSYVGLI